MDRSEKPKKPENNEERLKALEAVFAEQTAKAIAENKIRGIATMAVICDLAQVDTTYVYGHKPGTEDELAQYKRFHQRVIKFSKHFMDRKKDINDLAVTTETKYQNSLEQNHALLKDKVRLEVQCGLLRDKNNKLMAEKVHLQASGPDEGPKNIVPITDVTVSIISPDDHLERDSRYRFHDKKRRDQAWSKARTEFARLMKRKMQQRVYLLVGPPCSGKSTWAEKKNISPDRHAVIIDATNLTAGDRATWIVQAQKATDVKICVVHFLTAPTTLAARNLSEERRYKKLDSDVLEEKIESLEEVDPNFEEVDEILYVRESNES